MNSPAEIASEIALKKLYHAIDNKQNFRFEAGAGAGKTYSLIKGLKYLIEKESATLSKNNQKIACITYTNVAVDEINSRIDNNPLVFAGTIHSFCWSLIQGLQKQMRDFLPTISEKWQSRIDEAGGIHEQTIIYDLGYPKVTSKEIFLHHDDVIKIIANFLEKEKFRVIMFSRFPIILIDEYQDTNMEFANSIVKNILEKDNKFLIGLFGDHWQKIYGSVACGLITASEGKIEEIGKNANFRSDKNIIKVLNRMRPELPQDEVDPNSQGEITIFLTENWIGNRRTENHWQGDLPTKDAHKFLEETKNELIKKGWSFSPELTKILMLTNNVLATEQGYSSLASVFNYTEEYLKKENAYIAFLIDEVEPVCTFFKLKQFGEMFKSLGLGTIKMKKHDDKISWNKDLNKLIDIQKNGTIGDVIDHLQKTKRPRVPLKIEDAEKRFEQFSLMEDGVEKEKEKAFIDKLTRLKNISYSELIALSNYLDDKTPFSTKHGVKGAEFENVLVVCGRGWNNYNWNDFLEWARMDKPPKGKEDAFERNRNLFYVACSRPKKRLALLFTQKLSLTAIQTLELWFGKENISNLVLT
jgi:DNA helicase II / ATP-dependent DNA helicase PcrA